MNKGEDLIIQKINKLILLGWYTVANKPVEGLGIVF